MLRTSQQPTLTCCCHLVYSIRIAPGSQIGRASCLPIFGQDQLTSPLNAHAGFWHAQDFTATHTDVLLPSRVLYPDCTWITDRKSVVSSDLWTRSTDFPSERTRRLLACSGLHSNPH